MMQFLFIGVIALFGVGGQFVTALTALPPVGTNERPSEHTTSSVNLDDTHDASTNINNSKSGCSCLTPVDTSTTSTSSGQTNWLKQRQHLEDFYSRNVMVHGMMCSCNVAMRGVPMRDDYDYSVGIGAHKLHTRAATWNNARKVCNEEGGYLAIINSIVEEHVSVTDLSRSHRT